MILCCSSPNQQKKTHLDISAKLTKATFVDLINKYDFDPLSDLLGEGSYGKVYSATDKEDPSIKVAIKEINIRKMKESEILYLKREVKLLA